MAKMDQNAIDMRQCNAIVKEVCKMEKRERNMVFNVPESTKKEEEDRQKDDLRRTKEIFKELGFEDSRPENLK